MAPLKLMKSLFEWVEMILISVALALLINLFVLQPIRVEGSSMLPTLNDNDFVIISRIGKTLGMSIEYGDIVVVDKRTDRRRTLLDDIREISILNRFRNENLWIKRVIGKPGDHIEIRSGQLFRNDSIVHEPYLKDERMYDPDASFVVPPEHVFVMGDNRNNSMDSRRVGFIPVDNIKGRLAVDVSALLRKR